MSVDVRRETSVDVDVQPTGGALQALHTVEEENEDGESAEIGEHLEADVNDDGGEGADQTEVVEQPGGVESVYDENEDGKVEPSAAEPPIEIQAPQNKKNMCPCCQQPQTMLARHVSRMHKTEMEVCRAF